MNESKNIRAASLDDLAELIQLAQGCEEAPHWNETTWRSILQNDHGQAKWYVVLVVERYSAVVGYAVLSGNGEVAELESIVVLVAFRSRGLGKALCLWGMKVASERGAKSMELEVRSASLVPRRLYGSLGFVQQGIRRSYYRNPVDDAVLMSVALYDM